MTDRATEPPFPERKRALEMASNAVAELSKALEQLGIRDSFSNLRPDVNVYGHGVVNLGLTTPGVARILADVIESGRHVVFARTKTEVPREEASRENEAK